MAISERLRHEVRDKIRPTTIIPRCEIARAIRYAIEQPADVDVIQIVVRPAAQEF